MSGIAPKQNAFKFKITPHKQKSIINFIFGRKMPPLSNEALCLSTSKHNGKSCTGCHPSKTEPSIKGSCLSCPTILIKK
jgi:hypothetical protein